MAQIGIIDYGMGNLRSVQKAFERLGFTATILTSTGDLAGCSHLVLPGVGAFEDAMTALRHSGFVQPLSDWIDSGRPFLGICLGLQLLFEVSEEGGEIPGLGILPGKVVRFAPKSGYKVPHMGWNALSFSRPAPIFDGLPTGTHAYFVHSFYVVPAEDQIVAATALYPDRFTAAIWKDNIVACQFHPEKSQAAGLHMLRNFAQWQPQQAAVSTQA